MQVRNDAQFLTVPTWMTKLTSQIVLYLLMPFLTSKTFTVLFFSDNRL